MLIREHFEIKETAVTIITDSNIRDAKNALFEAREIIERKIADDPFFGITYDPYPVRGTDDGLIKRMCNASLIASVGPMAAVAGAVAVYAAERLKEYGSSYTVIDNGGDIALFCDKPVVIGLYGDPALNGISLRVERSETIRGICSSSGRIGPSVSFGNSDICTVFSDDVILADAAATRLGNLLNGTEIADALESVLSMNGIGGCMASIEGKVAMAGNIPELVRSEIDMKNIASIRLR